MRWCSRQLQRERSQQCSFVSGCPGRVQPGVRMVPRREGRRHHCFCTYSYSVLLSPAGGRGVAANPVAENSPTKDLCRVYIYIIPSPHIYPSADDAGLNSLYRPAVQQRSRRRVDQARAGRPQRRCLGGRQIAHQQGPPRPDHPELAQSRRLHHQGRDHR